MKSKSDKQKEQQIMAKLTHIRDLTELKRIYLSLEEQNSTLRSDVIHLNYKVGVLRDKQNPSNTLHSP